MYNTMGMRLQHIAGVCLRQPRLVIMSKYNNLLRSTLVVFSVHQILGLSLRHNQGKFTEFSSDLRFRSQVTITADLNVIS